MSSLDGEHTTQAIIESGALTNIYHVEKYLIPGASFVFFLFVFPILLTFPPESIKVSGEILSLGTILITSFIAGHYLESLKLYEWFGSRYLQEFDLKIEVLFGWDDEIDEKRKELCGNARSYIFLLIPEPERSDLAWQLVRWQKVIVLAWVFFLCSVEWLLILLHTTKVISIVNSDFQFWWLTNKNYGYFFETGLIVLFTCLGFLLYHNGRSKQRKTNGSLFKQMKRMKTELQKFLEVSKEEKAS